MNLMPIADIIESKGFAEQGKNLFINHFPADAGQGVLIRERLIGASLTPELPGYLKFNFQVIVRGYRYSETEELANNIAKALRLETEKTIGGIHFKYIRLQNVPVPFPITDGEGVEFAATFDVRCVDPKWV